jgi:hypothetical protein
MDMGEEELEIENNFITFKDTKAALQTLNSRGKQVNLIQINVRSLRKNWDIMLSHLQPIMEKIHILVLVEINLEQYEVSNYSIADFNLIAKPRATGRGGGIMIFCRKEIHMEEKDLTTQFRSAEILITDIHVQKEKFLLMAVYRPPSSNVNNFNNELDDLLRSESIRKEKNIIMMGDINICYRSASYGSVEYLDVLYSHGLYNTIHNNTRVELLNNNLVSSCIDHINIKDHNLDLLSYVIEEKVADHYLVGVSLKLRYHMDISEIKIQRAKEIISDKLVTRGIQAINWWPILDLAEPDDIYNEIKTNFDKVYKTSKIRVNNIQNKGEQNRLWINNDIKQMIIRKNEIWSQLKRNSHNTDLRNSFKKLRNDLTNLVRKTKRRYYFGEFSKIYKNTKKVWSLVNDTIGKKPKLNIKDTIKDNFKIEDDQLPTIIKEFNLTFKKTIESAIRDTQGEKFDIKNDMFNNPNINNTVSMNLQKINEQRLICIINNLNCGSSPGPDNIRAKDVKNNLAFIKLPILHFINCSINKGKIPEALKMTYIRPVHKKGKTNVTENYRPIGSISVLMKIMEQYVNHQINNYCMEHNILSNNQYGFVQKKSACDLLYRLTNDINTALDKNKYVAVASLDLTKAFDLVRYDIMLHTLEKIGIGGKLLLWFRDYFQGRSMAVSIGEYTSAPTLQTLGLIQGSVLAPQLFNLYVNDITLLRLHSDVLQYADDTIIYIQHYTIKTATEKLQEDMNLLTKYFFNVSIKLNPSKTQFIIFRGNRLNQHINTDITLCSHDHECIRQHNLAMCQCDKIRPLNSIKHLGLYLDYNMRYDTHISYLNRILKIALFKFYKISHILPVYINRIIYFSLIDSILRYGIIAYSTAPEYILKPIINTQNRILRTLFPEQLQDNCGLMRWKYLSKYCLLQKYYHDDRYRNIRTTGYRLRSTIYNVPLICNRFGSARLEYRVPVALNELPEEMRNLKKHVNLHLKHHFATQ